ncbi:hypothetical protein HYQ46_005340 [Verticillium longisporum]|nr:hypothetical protein HYQ46_005340 [Verticillium longisporum]
MHDNPSPGLKITRRRWTPMRIGVGVLTAGQDFAGPPHKSSELHRLCFSDETPWKARNTKGSPQKDEKQVTNNNINKTNVNHGAM